MVVGGIVDGVGSVLSIDLEVWKGVWCVRTLWRVSVVAKIPGILAEVVAE